MTKFVQKVLDYRSPDVLECRVFMKDPTTLVCALLIVAAGAYVERDKWMPKPPPPAPSPRVASIPAPAVAPIPPPPRKRNLAPPGTFYITQYVSVRTAHGMTGFVPGQRVIFVSANREKQLLTVTDGTNNVEVAPTYITNDLDVAAMALRQDEASQQRLAQMREREQQQFTKGRHKVDLDHAKDVSGVHSGAIVGGHSPLDHAPVAAGGVDASYYGDPYSYLGY